MSQSAKPARPGSWEYVDDGVSTMVVIDGHGISAPYREPHGSMRRCGQQAADNLLIAAAPELLAACERAAELIRNGGVVPIMGETWKCLRAAVDKATGVAR